MSADKRKSRVFWTDEEIHKVAEEALRLYTEDTSNLWSFVAEAQKTLPAHRQRTITGRRGISSELTQRFVEARIEFLESLSHPVEIQIEKEVRVETPREEILASITTEELLIIVARRLAPVVGAIPKILEKLAVASSEVLGAVPKPLATEPTTNGSAEKIRESSGRTRHPRVLLLEFLPKQEEAVRQKAGEFQLELVFGGKGNREKAPPSCNWCIMNKKVSHSTLWRTKSEVGNQHVFVVNGVDGALKKLADINAKVIAGT